MTNEQLLDQALQSERNRQESELIIDFDQAVESQRKKAITIKYQGKEYSVPAETPQWYMNIVNRKLHEARSLDYANLSEEDIIDRLEVSDKQNEDIFRRLFGDEFVDAYLDDNFVSFTTLNQQLLNPILIKWGWKPSVEKEEFKKKLMSA